MIKTFCDRCEADGNIISRTFNVDGPMNLEVIARPKDNAAQQMHICENCLAELLIACVETFPNSKVVTSYHTAFKTASELEAIRDENEQLATDKADLIKRSLKADDAIRDLEKKLQQAMERAELMQHEARKAKTEAEKEIKAKVAAMRQRMDDEKNNPDYIAATERRERIRSAR